MSDQERTEFFTACKKIKQAMLVTQNPEGNLHARPMVVAAFEDDGDLWFATDLDSAKVDEIQAKPKVCITMSEDAVYVSISGNARVVRDPAKIEELWNETWQVWFPGGKTDPRLALINVDARQGEYWSNSGLNGIKYLFNAMAAYAKGERPQVGHDQHGQVTL